MDPPGCHVRLFCFRLVFFCGWWLVLVGCCDLRCGKKGPGILLSVDARVGWCDSTGGTTVAVVLISPRVFYKPLLFCTYHVFPHPVVILGSDFLHACRCIIVKAEEHKENKLCTPLFSGEADR